MKTLLLLRHAKSSWKNPNLADHDRPLNKRGKGDAPRMGELLAELDLIPDTILTSTAKRAIKTAKLVAEACGFDGDLKTTRDLYFTNPDGWYALVQPMTNSHQRVMLVGHNPGMEEFLELVSGESEAMPTAALARIELNIDDWQDFRPGAIATLQNIWRPRELS